MVTTFYKTISNINIVSNLELLASKKQICSFFTLDDISVGKGFFFFFLMNEFASYTILAPPPQEFLEMDSSKINLSVADILILLE